MGKIQVLDEHMTNLIAAGEVIERACSVVKELVENAIDAGSSKITISLIDSGLNEIRVSDNGCGMDNNDAKLSIIPHATSKIKDQNDLFNIGTLGFRGEALASIVAVSNFKIITSNDGMHGTMLSLRGGVPLAEAMIARPRGTEVIVKNLFFNTPARLQNMQSPNVELSYITDYVSKMALAHNDIAFILSNNEKEILHTTGNGSLLEVISEVYSNDIARDMLEFDLFDGTFKINGYCSKINVTRSSKNNIVLIINGRIVHNSSIVNAVINGYGNLLMNGKYPIVVCNIEVDLGMVDVNVHPTKYEVRLSAEQELKDLLINSINDVLSKVDLSVQATSPFIEDEGMINDNISDFEIITDKKEENNNEDDDESETLEYLEDEEIESLEEQDKLHENDSSEYEEDDEEEQEDEIDFDFGEKFEETNIESVTSEYKKDEPVIEGSINKKPENLKFTFDDEETSENVSEPTNSDRLPKMFVIGQLFGTYILGQNEDMFYLVDQHAAMERINYEKIKADLSKNNVATYELLVPFTLTFSPAEYLLVKENMESINNLGITLEEFGNNTYVVREIPIWIFRGREREFVEEIITKIITSRGLNKIDFLDFLAKSLACKKSIKANEFHSNLEIEYLLGELAKTENPFTCPHGRPVVIKLTKQEIEKWFKRIV